MTSERKTREQVTRAEDRRQNSELRTPYSPLCILGSILVLGSIGFGQSFFNTRGLGEMTGPADAQTVGLGGGSALSYLNPGILVELPKTAFVATVSATGTVGSEAGRQRFFGTVRPEGFSSAFPLPFSTRLVLGLDQRFNQEFDVWSDTLADTACRYHVVGRGGIYALNAGLAKSLFGVGCVGLGYSHYLGSAREDWRFETPDGIYTSTDTVEVRYSANGLRLGAAVRTSVVSLAGYYEPAFGLSAQSFKRVHGLVRDSLAKYRFELPPAIALGATVEPFAPVLVAAGFEYRPWSRTRRDRVPADFLDAARFSAGIQYAAAPQHPVRLGYSYEPWYYAAEPGVDPGWSPAPQRITEHALSLGTSLPIPHFGSLDIAVELARRNSVALTETAGRLFLSLSYGEAWLKRTRRWGY